MRVDLNKMDGGVKTEDTYIKVGVDDCIWPMYVSVSLGVFSEPQEPVQRKLTELDQEFEKQAVQLRESETQELLKLRQELHLLEREKQKQHLGEVTTHTDTQLCAV